MDISCRLLLGMGKNPKSRFLIVVRFGAVPGLTRTLETLDKVWTRGLVDPTGAAGGVGSTSTELAGTVTSTKGDFGVEAEGGV